MSSIEERRAVREIRHYLASIGSMNQSADVILFPELSVPIGFVRHLERSAEKLQTILVAGLDYRIDERDRSPRVSNEAVIVIPRKLRGKPIGRTNIVLKIGKSYASRGELRRLNKVGGVEFSPDPTIWLFESEDIGNFGVAVCYDFMDLDRIVQYKTKIQSLFVLAYNRDITSFDHLAEAIMRMVFCNVVVCNCGFFGGSLAVSPYYKPEKRTIYRSSGQRLSNAQLFSLPLGSLKAHQDGDEKCEYKSLPPGYKDSVRLVVRSRSL